MVFAPDEGSEAVLCLEMSSDIELTGNEESPPYPERIDLIREVMSRQWFLLEFASDLPGPSGSGSTLKSPWPFFSKDSSLKYCTSGQCKRQAQNRQMNHRKKTHLPKPRKGKASLQKRCQELEIGAACTPCSSIFKPFVMCRPTMQQQWPKSWRYHALHLRHGRRNTTCRNQKPRKAEETV